MTALPPTVRRCDETRAHYAHEWFNPLHVYCPGGPDEFTFASSRFSAHQCEPPYFPTELSEHWTCPGCGQEYRAFDFSSNPFLLRLSPKVGLGWGLASITPDPGGAPDREAGESLDPRQGDQPPAGSALRGQATDDGINYAVVARIINTSPDPGHALWMFVEQERQVAAAGGAS